MGKERLASFIHERIVLPLTSGDPERTHDAVFRVCGYFEKSESFLQLLRKEFEVDKSGLAVEVLGVEFSSPVLLAAGMVKYGSGAATVASLGPGGVELGTFTLGARVGNPRVRTEVLDDSLSLSVKVKRVERFSDGTIINWMGLPNPGIRRAAENIQRLKARISKPFGINIAPTPGLPDIGSIIADLKQNLEVVYSCRPSWITLNLSCPNTADSDRQERTGEAIKTLQGFAVTCQRIEDRVGYRVPKLVKIGPDMSACEIRAMVIAIKECRLQGIVATNTTTDRTGIRMKYVVYEKGGLSGPRLFEKSFCTVRLVRQFDRTLGGDPLVLIACGGIDGIEKLQQMRVAGADLFQVATPFIFGGPYFFKQINRDYLGLVRG